MEAIGGLICDTYTVHGKTFSDEHHQQSGRYNCY